MKIPQYGLYLLLGALVSLPTVAAALGLQPAGTTADGRNRYLITSASSTSTRVNGFRQFAHGMLWLKDADGIMSQCGSEANGGYYRDCSNPTWYQPVTCNNAAEAISMFRRLVGNFIYYDGNGVAKWQFHCASAAGNGWAIDGQVTTVPKPPPVSCNSTNPTIFLYGRVGERAEGVAEWNIQCTSQANLRLTITKKGVVPVEGGGEVLLTYKTNGADVLNVNTASTSIVIKGELTKSPATAGTYRGSAVLTLDIL